MAQVRDEIIEEHRSPDGVLCLCVVRHRGGDVSIGFRGSDWRTHGDIEAELSGLPQDEAVRRFVDRILGDQVAIAIERVGGRVTGIWPTEDPAAGLRYCPAGAVVECRRWSGKLACGV